MIPNESKQDSSALFMTNNMLLEWLTYNTV